LCISFTVPQTAVASTGQPEPEAGESASTDPAAPLPQSSWEALVGSQVELTRSDGNRVVGQLLGVDESSATLVMADGAVVAVPVADVTAVRRVVTSEPPPPTASDSPAPSE